MLKWEPVIHTTLHFVLDGLLLFPLGRIVVDLYCGSLTNYRILRVPFFAKFQVSLGHSYFMRFGRQREAVAVFLPCSAGPLGSSTTVAAHTYRWTVWLTLRMWGRSQPEACPPPASSPAAWIPGLGVNLAPWQRAPAPPTGHPQYHRWWLGSADRASLSRFL